MKVFSLRFDVRHRLQRMTFSHNEKGRIHAD
jgi:hypothetical protein